MFCIFLSVQKKRIRKRVSWAKEVVKKSETIIIQEKCVKNYLVKFFENFEKGLPDIYINPGHPE